MQNAAPFTILVDDFPPARRSLRIAVVTETYPPEVNGVAMTIARAVEGLRARNHELQLVRPRQDKADVADNGERFVEVLLRGLPIPRYPQLKMGMPSKKALVSLWTRRRPDVVHLATEGPLGWSALQAARHLRLPVVSDFRTNFHAYSKHYGIGWLRNPIMGYLRKFHNHTACTMVPTQALARDLAAAGFRQLEVVARGVDTRHFDPARRSEGLRKSWGAGPRTRVVLCVGRLAPEKNLGTLLAAFEAMREAERDLRLVLVGDGPSRGVLQARCPEAHFAGVRSGDDLAAHYASADLFVFPSMTETFGNVIPEAMASGLPALAYDCAAAAQLIRHGESGWLARVDDSAGFVRLAARAVADFDDARAIGQRAREVALRLDWERVIGQIEARYLWAIDGAEPARGMAPLAVAG